MPSGITSDIYEDKDVTLRDYLMRVGRGMAFAIMQRDSDQDEPVKRCEPNTKYYDEKEQSAQARIAELTAMTSEEVAQAAREDFERERAAWEQRKAENAALRARYEAMLAEVEAWEPDPLIAGTKEYALRMLRESIDFDCGRPDEEDRYYPEPTEQEPNEWLRYQLGRAHEDVGYAQKHRADELARAEERNRYIDAFYASLPPAESDAHVGAAS